MEKEEFIKIVEEETTILKDVQKSMVRDESVAKTLLNQLDRLKQNIIDKVK